MSAGTGSISTQTDSAASVAAAAVSATTSATGAPTDVTTSIASAAGGRGRISGINGLTEVRAEAGQIRAGEDGGNAGQGGRFRRLDPGDPAVRLRAAHEGCVEAAGDADVVGEPALPGQERTVLDAQAGLSDAAGRCGWIF